MLTFELQAHREAKLSSRPSASLAMLTRGRAGSAGAAVWNADVTTIFTESLILAQDERWRRA
jgi:hypothetical protein